MTAFIAGALPDRIVFNCVYMHILGGRCQEVSEDARTGHYRPQSWSYRSLGTTGDWELDLSLLQEVLTTMQSPQPLCPFII